MNVELVIVGAIVIGALAYLIRSFRRARKPAGPSGTGCDSCGH